ncbi:MAG TPA: hypothetical protein VMV45_00515 [Casimicrobiaceae bacterium]|nr:hypothetical protein [Casimicrobiaceae bacterium]
MNEAWFNAASYAFIPGVVIGIAGAALGLLAGSLAPRGKAKWLVIGFHIGIIIVSLGLLALGVLALAEGQPYGVWYGLGLPGLIGVAVFGSLYGVVQRRYREAEEKRMSARDLD